jgi:hypothetical protein
VYKRPIELQKLDIFDDIVLSSQPVSLRAMIRSLLEQNHPESAPSFLGSCFFPALENYNARTLAGWCDVHSRSTLDSPPHPRDDPLVFHIHARHPALSRILVAPSTAFHGFLLYQSISQRALGLVLRRVFYQFKGTSRREDDLAMIGSQELLSMQVGRR